MQEKQMTNDAEITNLSMIPAAGRIIAIDPGTKYCGVAVCDETQTLARPLKTLVRTSWKKLLLQTKGILTELDAVALVVGLPYNFDGSESEMSADARSLSARFTLSLTIPVIMQDERATSYEAKQRLWQKGISLANTKANVDSEAAAIILEDFLDRLRAHRQANSV